MEATTPTGSRRIIEVCPSRYSPAAIPGRQRAAPAKKRKTSAMAGISSLITQCSGLPQFSDSSCARFQPAPRWRPPASGDIPHASSASSDSGHRMPGPPPQRRHRLGCCRFGNLGITSPVAGLYTGTFSPSPATNLPFINRLCCIALSCFMVLFPVSGVVIAVAGEPPGP